MYVWYRPTCRGILIRMCMYVYVCMYVYYAIGGVNTFETPKPFWCVISTYELYIGPGLWGDVHRSGGHAHAHFRPRDPSPGRQVAHQAPSDRLQSGCVRIWGHPWNTWYEASIDHICVHVSVFFHTYMHICILIIYIYIYIVHARIHHMVTIEHTVHTCIFSVQPLIRIHK